MGTDNPAARHRTKNHEADSIEDQQNGFLSVMIPVIRGYKFRRLPV
jgi:hypothetical protein